MSTVDLRHNMTGEDLVILRRKIGCSPQTMAEYLGLRHESQLSEIESGRRRITYYEEALLKRLAEAFASEELE
jgi:transcriptional regulator with XRE-family HTH domain